jgi:hypothetical protein
VEDFGSALAQHNQAAAANVNIPQEMQHENDQTAGDDLEASRVGTPFYLAPELWKNP